VTATTAGALGKSIMRAKDLFRELSFLEGRPAGRSILTGMGR